MGEEEWRVHRAGAPSLDHLQRNTLYPRTVLEQRLGIDLSKPTLLVAYHPVTILRDTTSEADALFGALSSIPGQILFCYPNSDAGSRALIEQTQYFLRQRDCGYVFTNMSALTYWSLLIHVDALIGNSSSGIMETASFCLPTVNIGMRQTGRERARNVIDAEPNAESISNALLKAQSPAFHASLVGMTNPYGEGRASETIVRVLTTSPLGQHLLIKHAPDTRG
jgi:UDP-N-acetylglucosamine 2-epimerase (non-hydrolysing)/GDP/UDP-N,N'-diacetylbacillosamine 2-epimerase (hydrolysing)